MPNVITADDIAPIDTEINEKLDAAEEQVLAQMGQGVENSSPGDLSDGGRVGMANILPMGEDGNIISRDKGGKGRAVAIQAWDWRGTESLLPLAWDPDGRIHDAARRYLLKRVCLCCQFGGWRGTFCKPCRESNCPSCQASTDRTKIAPHFYLRKEDVPFPERFYGDIDCFLASCVRRGAMGFQTEEDMRMHARSRHRMEYQSYMESRELHKTDEMDTLRMQVAALTARLLQGDAAQAAPAATEAPADGGETIEATGAPLEAPAGKPHAAHLYDGKQVGSRCKVPGCDAVRTTPYRAQKKKRK